MTAKRELISHTRYVAAPNALPWQDPGKWPAKWIELEGENRAPFVALFRLKLNLSSPLNTLVHVVADERYDLWIDGEPVGEGNERGDRGNWFFESYRINLEAGEHTIVAKVWAIGEKAPFAQMTVRPGFLFCPEDEAHVKLLATGEAAWESKLMLGYEFIDQLAAWGTGVRVKVHGDMLPPDWRTGGGESWVAPRKGENGYSASNLPDLPPSHMLVPATLPAMMGKPWTKGTVRHVDHPPTGITSDLVVTKANDLADEHQGWTDLLRFEKPLTIPANTRRRVIFDLDDYVCAYPEVILSGGKGNSLRVHWQEALYDAKEKVHKGNRDEIEGKVFTTVWHKKDGVGDIFISGGTSSERFDTLWFSCGRYVEFLVETGNESTTIEKVVLYETRYPIEPQTTFSTDDPRAAEVEPLMVRVLQMCSHETYYDCPFYEQLMYIGDTRLQALVTMCISQDDRLVRKALRMFDVSRQVDGITQSRYPSRVRQIIPPFSLWWVAMVHDYAAWRGDKEFVASLMPGVRAVLDHYRQGKTEGGLLHSPKGWNFIDWVPKWNGGVPPGGNEIGANLNLKAVWVLRQAAEIEEWLGEPELAARCRREAKQIMDTCLRKFYNQERGLFADDLAHTSYSEHAQCLALLAGISDKGIESRCLDGLQHAKDLHKTTVYFRHYLLETFWKFNRPDLLWKELDLWWGLKGQGFKTVLEHNEPSRSDCHAWGAHPMFHFRASMLGIRPGGLGGKHFTVNPHLGPLKHAEGGIMTSAGEVHVKVDASGVHVSGPAGIEITK